jgi:hypothetical protein
MSSFLPNVIVAETLKKLNLSRTHRFQADLQRQRSTPALTASPTTSTTTAAGAGGRKMTAASS